MSVHVDALQASEMFGRAVLYGIRMAPSITDDEADLPFLTRVKAIYVLLANALPRELKSSVVSVLGSSEAFTAAEIEKHASFVRLGKDRHGQDILTAIIKIRATEVVM